MTEIAAVLVGAAAAVIAVVSAIIADRQAREARRARDISALLPLYQAHESLDFAPVRQLIRRAAEDREQVEDPAHDREAAQQLRAYINHLNFVCILVKERLVTKAYAAAIFQTPIANCVKACRDYIAQKRKENPEFASDLREVQRG
jgi:hypothetical protein